MKILFLISFLILNLAASGAASKIDDGKKITDDTNSEIEKINLKNNLLITLDKEKNVKILNLESTQQKINEQNGI